MKKKLKKKAEVENLEEIGYQANLEIAYNPLTESLNKFVKRTKETKKVLEAIENIPKKLTLEDKLPLLAIYKIPIETVDLGEIAVKYLSNAMKKNVYDITYGLKPIEGSYQFKLGNKKVYVLGNKIRIEVKLYELGEEE